MDNAIRYTPPHGRVTLRTCGGTQPAIEIEDSGPGIAPEERERVFAPFYRAASAHAANQEGSGLGLTIVRDIAATHNARVALENGAARMGLRVVVTFLSS